MATVDAQALISGRGGKTNWIRNPRGDGAVVGGSMPTFWSSPLLPGLSQQVVGVGTDAASGIAYVDIQYFGTIFSDGNLFIYVEPSSYNIVAHGDTFTATAYIGMPDGDLTNIGQIAYNVTITTGNITLNVAPPGHPLVLYSGSGTVGAGGTSIGLCYFSVFVRAGDVNITLRLGGFQLERGLFRTPLILPPLGSPQITTRPLLAGGSALVPVAAQINGTGGVRAATRGQVLAQAEIDGATSLRATAAVPGQAYGGTLIAGEGKITPLLNVRLPASALIPGTGSATANASGRVPVSNTRLGGLGSVYAAAVALRPASAKFAGLGGRVADTRVLRAARAAIAGTGGLRASAGASLKSAAARIAGTGGVRARTYQPVAVLGGRGGFAVSAWVLARTQARIVGVGALRATITPLAWARAQIDAGGYVEADIDSFHHTGGAVAGVGRLTANPTIARGAAAIIHGAGGLRAAATQVHQTYHLTATIHGTGAVRADGIFRGAYHAPNKVTQPAAARIAGAGTARATTTRELAAAAHIAGTGAVRPTAIVKFAQHAAALLGGTGAVRAIALVRGVPKQVTAALHGTGAVRAIGRAVLHTAAAIHGTGGVRASGQPRIHWAGSAAIHGTGGLRASGQKRTTWAASAAIHGTGAVRASGQPRIHWAGSAAIHGAGAVRAAGQKRTTWVASAIIHGTGGLRAAPGAARQAHAVIAGAGGIRASSRLLARVRAWIAGAGHVQGVAIKAPWHVAARIVGAGGVRPSGRWVTSGGARINGRAALRAHPGVALPAAARIAGAGRVRLQAHSELHARTRLAGQGGVIADGDQQFIHHAVARIAGQGGIAPDPFIPRDRVALYGVHLPATKRSVAA
jgi:hypothetical protein